MHDFRDHKQGCQISLYHSKNPPKEGSMEILAGHEFTKTHDGNSK